ncbi:MAG: CDP-diacylglycerol--serine O-phosphatidyltransferase [Candidatus Marinimicrobia bacterium]|nr:CDP-diacylglycerol--serine O-phosphatidyltransferase [Candidatus Neomarinimicrobiota bacterium]|tara:strand:- start:19973 stop:20734 length:762 start_codon:yes stop_codon:yes gene_type:complete
MKKMRVRKQAVPGAFTFFNLFFGFLAIIQASHGRFENACWLILLASLFDALDGPTARALKVSTPFGIEFDSIADIVSFCTAPAVLIYLAFTHGLHPLVGGAISFVPLFAGAFRLARFNLGAANGPSTIYRGLPSTAFAVTLSAFGIFSSRFMGTIGDPRIVILMVLVLSTLMVSHIPYPKLTYIGKSWHSHVRVSFFLLILAALTWWLSLVLFPLAMIYVLGNALRVLIDHDKLNHQPSRLAMRIKRKYHFDR